LDAAVLDGDLAPERRGEAENQAALQLRHDRVGIHDDAGVDRRHEAFHADHAASPTSTSATVAI
jgi:hypothetical protein